MKLLFIFLAFGFSFLLFNSCHERGPLFPDPALGLGLRDFSCTEAWIEVQVGNNDKTANIYIKKDDEIIKTITLGQSDSIFYFDDLQPNTSYKFDAVTYDDGKEIKSNPVTFTTLDTTSHNFTWQTFEFGQHSSSVLYDVAIIDENNIWAVGEIYMNDSLGNPDPEVYNAVNWDGQSWELKKIKTNACGGVDYPTIKASFAFSTNDVLFAHIDGSITYFNGIGFINDCSLITQLNGSVNKIWGVSKNDFYVVSVNGFIAHYKNGSWKRIESETTANIQDVLGFTDTFTSETNVYCAVSYVFQNGDRKILRIKNNKVDSLSWLDDKRINSIWTPNNYIFYTAGDGVFENKKGYWKQVDNIPPYYSNNIRGNGLNDVFVCGDFGLLSHFNGSSWFTYKEHYLQGILFSVATKNNIVVTVGLNGSKATIIQGIRN